MIGLIGRLLAAGASVCAALSASEPSGAADLVRVGEGPFITGGAFFIAREKGYFKKVGLEIETKRFEDGAFAVPAIIAGELEFTLMTANASLFNSIAKGAPLVVILDRGHNRPGFGYTALSVTQAISDTGVKSLGDVGKLKGKRIGVGALGSINQYNAAQALLKAGLDPAKDVQWIVNVPQPDLTSGAANISISSRRRWRATRCSISTSRRKRRRGWTGRSRSESDACVFVGWAKARTTIQTSPRRTAQRRAHAP